MGGRTLRLGLGKLRLISGFRFGVCVCVCVFMWVVFMSESNFVRGLYRLMIPPLYTFALSVMYHIKPV